MKEWIMWIQYLDVNVADVELKNKCCGLLGWLFGHKMVKFLNKSTPLTINLENIADWHIRDIVQANTVYEYSIKCKRCGAKCEE